MSSVLTLFKRVSMSDILAIIGIILAIIPLIFLKDAQYNAIIIVFGEYLLILFIIIVWREYSYSRKARYAEANKNIHACMHSIRDAYYFIDLKNKDEAIKNINKLLDSLADAYTLITGTQCRSCIKSIVIENAGNPEDIYTETFARSGSSDRTNIHNTNNKSLENDLVKVRENTDFSSILFRGKSHYLCDDLTKEPAYRNSSWPDDPEKFRDFIKKREYKYKSTLVLPIRMDKYYIGFLCVDSLAAGVFGRRYDVDTVAIIADTLYFLLKHFKDEPTFHS